MYEVKAVKAEESREPADGCCESAGLGREGGEEGEKGDVPGTVWGRGHWGGLGHSSQCNL